MSNTRFLLISDIHGNINAISKLVSVRLRQKNRFSGIIVSGDLPATVPFVLITEYILRWRNLSRLGYSREVYHGKLRNQFVKIQLQSLRYMIPLLEKFKIPIYYVSGNVETKEAVNFIETEFQSITFLEKKNVLIDDKFLLSGVGGSLEHLGVICDNEYSTEMFNAKIKQMRNRIEKENQDLKKIFVFHEPPLFKRSTLEHRIINEKVKRRGYKYEFPIVVGSKKIFELIQDFKPLIAVNGHYHEYAGKRKISNTIIINPGPLATYNYSILTIKMKKNKETIFSDFYKIQNNSLSFINFLYQKRSYTNQPTIFHY